ncbi:hypothetical protein [Novipirellula caenicola]|uniref:hypothetical protein n=1 Tax=Novipirellula caenicola TaxID=1536901 RepID=UPI0031E5CBBD
MTCQIAAVPSHAAHSQWLHPWPASAVPPEIDTLQNVTPKIPQQVAPWLPTLASHPSRCVAVEESAMQQVTPGESCPALRQQQLAAATAGDATNAHTPNTAIQAVKLR